MSIEVGSQPSLAGTDEVDDFTVRVYERTLSRHSATPTQIAADLDVPLDRVDEAFLALRRLRLVREVAADSEELRAVSPEAARMELLVPLERAIQHKRQRLIGVKGQLQSFATAFSNMQQGAPPADTIVVSDDLIDIELRLVGAAQRCRSEVIVMQSCVAQDIGHFRPAAPLVLEAVRRGARARVLYPHTARGDRTTRAHARDLIEAGGQVRTSRENHGRFVIFDREVAFVQIDGGPNGRPGVAVIQEPAIASFLADLHDTLWQSALDLEASTVGYEGVRTELKATILELLAAGLKDEVIAKRVGMSDRSFRRHLAAILQELGVDSRFQAGVVAARTGLLRTLENAGSQSPQEMP